MHFCCLTSKVCLEECCYVSLDAVVCCEGVYRKTQA